MPRDESNAIACSYRAEGPLTGNRPHVTTCWPREATGMSITAPLNTRSCRRGMRAIIESLTLPNAHARPLLNTAYHAIRGVLSVFVAERENAGTWPRGPFRSDAETGWR